MSKTVALTLIIGCCALLTACPERADQPSGPSQPTPVATPTPVPTPPPTPTPIPTPTPLPKTFIPWQKLDTAKIYNGIEVKSEFITTEGTHAIRERKDEDSFVLELSLRLRVPKPNDSFEEITKINPALPTLLPGLPTLMESAKVSDFYHGLYKNKVRDMQRRLTRLDRLLSRHNFYDCETILEMRHPDSGRRVLFMQAEMDVVGDGSDGDRLLKVDQTSSTFQPFTSYRWNKRTKNPNEFLAIKEAKLKEYQDRYAVKGLSAKENSDLAAGIKRVKLEIADLKIFSFLLARADPFIVIPGFMRRYSDNPYSPQLGDYAVVVYDDNIFPAIVGDVGPSTKTGEASLRICREIDPKSGPYWRAESDLVVSYIIFPHSADKPFGPPDLRKWEARCKELLGEIGGYNGNLHEWEDLTAPPPTPTPVPTPTPTPPVDPAPITDPAVEEVSTEDAAQATPSDSATQIEKTSAN